MLIDAARGWCFVQRHSLAQNLFNKPFVKPLPLFMHTLTLLTVGGNRMTFSRKLKSRLPIRLQKFLSDTVRFFRELPFLAEDLEKSRNLKNEITLSRSAAQRIWYFAVPLHSNLGDQAQSICIREWLTNYFPNAAVLEIPTRTFLRAPFLFFRWIGKAIHPNDYIVFQSGYTMTDFHPDEKLRRLILTKYRENPTLIFPQTILYQSEKSKNQSAKLFHQCPRLLLLARDKISLKEAEFLCPDHAAYWPDMVSGWIGRYSFSGDRKGILFCVRQDGESLLSPNDRKDILQLLEIFAPVEICGTEASFQLKNPKSEIESLIYRFSHAKLIVTDRYHGMLFALAAGVPVIALPVNGHKVFSGAQELAALYAGYVQTAVNKKQLQEQTQKLLNSQLPLLQKRETFFQDLDQLVKTFL
jgi:exopolysaccharide biosynthesis predicted pyruvyltransferase EpsI